MPKYSVQIKRIAIGKCDLFFHYRDTKEISFYSFRVRTLHAKHECACNCPFMLLESCL